MDTGYTTKELWLSSGVVSACVAVLLIAGAVRAHDVWLATGHTGSGELRALVHYGHPADRQLPITAKVFELRVLGNDPVWRSLLPDLTSDVDAGHPVLVSAPFVQTKVPGIWLVTAGYDNGYWVKTAAGSRNTSKRQVPEAAASVLSMKLAKAFVSAGPRDVSVFQRAIGHRLELVPVNNLATLRPPEPLQVQVLFDGQPLAGAAVELGDGMTPRAEQEIPRYTTNAAGVAMVPLGRPGFQLLVVEHDAPSLHPDLCDRERYNATLSFPWPLHPIPWMHA